MNRGIVYLILNKQTGEKYVGNTTLAMNKEWVYHIDRSKRMSSEPLHKAFRDYGVHNFIIKELDECDGNLLEERTTYWIEQYKPEYNPFNPVRKSVSDVVKAEESMQEKREPAIEIPKPKSRRNVTTSHLIQWNEQNRGDGKHLGLKIRGKNLETGLCKDYNSVREAAIDITGNPNANSNILNAARNYKNAYGYRWQVLEDKKNKKPVFGVNKKTEQIEVRYESMNAAIRAFNGNNKQKILKSLKNPGKYSWCGYWWFYG